MTEHELLQMMLDIKEIQVDGFEVEDRRIHIHCSSVFEEALCPHCLHKRQAVNQTYVRSFRDLPIAGKEAYLHLRGCRIYGRNFSFSQTAISSCIAGRTIYVQKIRY
jgi:transposase